MHYMTIMQQGVNLQWGGESIDGDEIAGDSVDGDATATTEPVGPAGGRWPGRIRKEPDRFAYNVKGVSKIGTFDWPASIQEALKREDADLWVEAINSELRSIFEKQVYEECDLPPGKKALSTKMVLNIKRDQFDNITKYKARLVVRGFLQEEGVDFSEVFAPTAQTASFRVWTSVAAQLRYEIHQIDVCTAFLNGELEEEVYVKLPSSICTSKKVWKLKRALYGLKQAARMWNEKLCKELTGFGYVQSQTDPCLFFKGSGANVVYLLIHVDDAIIVGPKPSIDEAKAALASVFDIKDMGLASYFLALKSLDVIRAYDCPKNSTLAVFSPSTALLIVSEEKTLPCRLEQCSRKLQAM
jgi:hypothetical protein